VAAEPTATERPAPARPTVAAPAMPMARPAMPRGLPTLPSHAQRPEPALAA
jgi:hypothetical protein